MNKALQSKRKGFALALVMTVLVILLLTGAGLLSIGEHGRIFAIQTSSEIAARCAADAGLTKAIFEMNEQLKVKPWDGSTLPLGTDVSLPNCDAVFSYTVMTDGDDNYTIESIGSAGQAERTVNCTLRLQGLFEHAILGVEKIEMKNNNLITGYNSATGETDVEVQIGTLSIASDSVLFGTSTIEGDIFVGVGGDVAEVIDSGGTINGQTYALNEELVLPTISPPELTDKGTIDVQSTTVLSPADSGKYAAITSLSLGGILEISGGDVVLHITGNIDIDNSGEIQIKDGSSLSLYVDGNITFTNNAGINNETGISANLKVYSTGEGEQVFELKNNTDAFGVVYAPNADIILKNNANLYGSITAKNFTIMNNGTFYYDAALRNVSISDEGVRFVVERWGE